MLDRIAELRQEGEAAVAGAVNTAALEDVRVRFLGRKAELPNLLRGVAVCAPASSATRSPGSSSMSAARAIETPKIEPMLARTALGEWGSAQPGPNATHEAPKACAERSTVPTLPGSPTPCK